MLVLILLETKLYQVLVDYFETIVEHGLEYSCSVRSFYLKVCSKLLLLKKFSPILH